MLQVIILDQLSSMFTASCFRFITLGFFRVFGKWHASGFRQVGYLQVAILEQVARFRFSASCKLHASGFQQVACFRFSASCMLQVFGKLHASGFRQVACFRFSASCMLQVFGKLHASG